MKIIRQKPLLPSLKEKKRYIVFEIISKTKVSFSAVRSNIEDSFLRLNGLIGAGKTGLMFLKDWENNKGIIRVNNKYVDSLKSCFCVLRKVNKDEIILRTVGVSGTLKQARSKYMGVDL